MTTNDGIRAFPQPASLLCEPGPVVVTTKKEVEVSGFPLVEKRDEWGILVRKWY